MNLEKFTEIKELLGDEFPRLMEVYQADTLERIAAIDICIQSDDFRQIRQLAHAMKSSSANIGADRVSVLAAEMEELAMRASRDEIVNLYPVLKKAIDEVILMLNN